MSILRKHVSHAVPLITGHLAAWAQWCFNNFIDKLRRAFKELRQALPYVSWKVVSRDQITSVGAHKLYHSMQRITGLPAWVLFGFAAKNNYMQLLLDHHKLPTNRAQHSTLTVCSVVACLKSNGLATNIARNTVPAIIYTWPLLYDYYSMNIITVLPIVYHTPANTPL